MPNSTVLSKLKNILAQNLDRSLKAVQVNAINSVEAQVDTFEPCCARCRTH